MRNNISEYYSNCGTKKAVVVKHGNDYSVDVYCNDVYNHTIMYAGKSIQFIEDLAENYILDRYKNLKDFE